jgi:hypothetical protein
MLRTRPLRPNGLIPFRQESHRMHRTGFRHRPRCLQQLRQKRSRSAVLGSCDYGWWICGDDVSAFVACTRADVDDPIARCNHLHVALDDDDGVTCEVLSCRWRRSTPDGWRPVVGSRGYRVYRRAERVEAQWRVSRADPRRLRAR